MGRGFHLVSNGRMSFEEMAAAAKEADFLHLREPGKSARELSEGIELLLKQGVLPEKIIVNDRVDVAMAKGVHGVQLGYRSLSVAEVKRVWPNVRTGCSVHSLGEAEAAAACGADWLIYGHIFSTNSKAGVPPRGLAELALIGERVPVPVPVIAIGGMTPGRIAEVMEAGAAGIAVMSGIWEAADPAAEVRKYQEVLKGMR
ncbi:thiamine phosphate synthase [Ectobacillus ponti]|uniref:Thiamine phosphate synthase n=1 Tax=Ectobacillus ponti TaxID=2961894 RepID=A0AA41X9Y9_9BACI|nr:thiamine phosphate synthase [Ectobacillus ponti]MCP8968131.1 thiamine phosphate synthase [Ectobacillus ponti]